MKKINLNIQVLVVDDSGSMRRILKKFLMNNGFQKIVEAKDGAEAVNIIEKESIGLIISDLNMPNMDGLKFLKIVKEEKRTQHIPFIMLTVEAIQKTMNKAIALNVNSYIVKPVTETTFMNEVFRVLRPEN